MADWKALEVQVPGKDILEPVRNVLETLLVYLDVLKAILETIKVFLVDFGNPLRALVEALIKIIEELFLSMKTTGVSALFHVPNPVVDPNFELHRGFDSFTTTFKQSLFDAKDLNRPQPRAGSTRGGYVLLMVQADAPFSLLSKIGLLLRFFSKEFLTPRFEDPRNFKATPVGSEGTPILSVAGLFDDPPNAVQLSWSLPTSAETPDTGFSDLVNRVAHEFVPPKFLIEKSKVNPASQVIDISEIKTSGTAGKVEFEREMYVAGTNTPVQRRELLRDNNGEPVIKFTETILIDETDLTSILGQLGTFRYVDTDIEPDQTYYYRVRALAGDIQLTGDGQIDWGDPVKVDNHQVPSVRWPSKSQDSVVVAGKPTGIVSVRIPTPVEDFDVVENLKAVLRSAFSLDFHRQDVFGMPKGTATLMNYAGAVGNKEFYGLFTRLDGQKAEDVLQLELVQGPITFPWDEAVVRRQSARLADTIASAMVESGDSSLERFRSLMRSTEGASLGQPTLEDAVLKATGAFSIGSDQYAAVFTEAYNDGDYREALSGVVELLVNYLGGGVAPDWITVSPLRDIAPWSGQILYELLDKVEALVDSFAGVSTEINNFIDLLTRKVETLERTLEFLISILELIESLQIGAFMLSVPEIEGDVTEWIDQLDTAGGDAPSTGPGGYSAGVALAYVATDVTAFKTAFSAIFG